MTRSQKTSNPKKLTLPEIWELYRVLNVGKTDSGYITTLMGILTNTPPPMLLTAFRLMYPKVPLENGPVFLTHLSRGLEVNGFFGFVEMIRKLG